MKYVILIPSYEADEKLIELLETIDKKIDIIVVNDGSSSSCNKIYEEAKKYAHIISYDDNMGKGYALKEGLKYIKDNYKETIIATMDGDGQHTFKDAKKLLDYASKHENTLVIGKRHWDKTTPKSNRIGNTLARKLYKRYTHTDIYDTQSGLRAFSSKMLDYMIKTSGDRYEYEMNVLMNLKENNIKAHEIDIETIYIDNNSRSHYKSIIDTYRIYKVMKEDNQSKKIRKNKTIIIAIMIIFLFIIFYVIGFDFAKNKTEKNLIRVTYKENCDESSKLYYMFNNRKIHLYCIDKVEINYKNNYIELKDYLKNNDIENILKKIKVNSILKDGGTTIYKESNYTIIRCNTLDGNKDIYIGPDSMNNKDNFCISENPTFKREYKINSIEKNIDDNENNSYKVNLSDKENTADVIINNIDIELELNNIYEFEFKKTNDIFEDNINLIFENNEIITVRKVD